MREAGDETSKATGSRGPARGGLVRALVLATLGLGLVTTTPALADDASPAPDAVDTRRESREVPVVVAGDDARGSVARSVRDVLAATLRDAVTPTFESVPSIEERAIVDPSAEALDRAAFARVWIDVRADVAIVSIADAPWERVYVRRIALPSGIDPVTREEIAHVVTAAVETLRDGGTIGVARTSLAPEPAPSPVSPEPPPPPPASPSPNANVAPKPDASASPSAAARGDGAPIGLQLAIGYEAVLFDARLVHGPIALVRASLPIGDELRLALALSGQPRSTVSVEPSPIGLDLEAFAARAAVEIERDIGARVSLRAGLGAGFDVLSVTPRLDPRAAGAALTTPSSRTSPIVRLSAGLDVRLLGRARLSAAAVVDADLDNRDYIVRDADLERPVLSPAPLRPGALLVLTADLLAP